MPNASKKPLRNQDGVSLYIHFPFCLYKCHYCDFNSYAFSKEKIPFEEYSQSLIREMRLREEAAKREGRHYFEKGSLLSTIYLGGGTPSLMPAQSVERILEHLARYFVFSPSIEITLEANPKTLDSLKLADFKKAGVNRVSMGVQSLDDAYLSAFGRIHSADDARRALDDLAQAGFRSWNADLIAGFPGQSLGEWQMTLKELLRWNPPHLSCYLFTAEEGTIYQQKLRQGLVSAPVEEEQSAQFNWTRLYLREKGYSGYEISNFCRPGHESRHNINYWNYGSYVGLGAGAVSFFHEKGENSFGVRTTNFKEPFSYMSSIRQGRLPWREEERISQKTAMGEFFMMGLRLKEGIENKRFERYFHQSLEGIYGGLIRSQREKGWMRKKRIALTDRGTLFSNQVMADFYD